MWRDTRDDLTTDREAHLWWTRSGEVCGRHDIRACEQLLSFNERARLARFQVAAARHEYLVTRAFVRLLLSRYTGLAPGDWCFAANAYGRPAIAAPQLTHALSFNLSHSGGFIACLISRRRLIGVDVEDVHRSAGTLAMSEVFLSPAETAALRATPERQRQMRFFEYWTLKESYMKARGMGLSLPLAKFSFELPPAVPDSPRIHFDDDFVDDPDAWHFELVRPEPRYVVAVSVRKPVGGTVNVSIRREFNLAAEHFSLDNTGCR